MESGHIDVINPVIHITAIPGIDGDLQKQLHPHHSSSDPTYSARIKVVFGCWCAFTA